MGFIERTERKFGKYAVSGIGFKLVVFQSIIFLLMVASNLPEIEKKISILNIPGTHFISDLLLLAGMPVMFPGNELSYIFYFFGCYILIMCCNALESVWGQYKFNLYILTYLIIGTITLQIIRHYLNIGIVTMSYFPSSQIRINMLSLLHMTVFIGYAIIFPKIEILAFFILPVTFGFLAILETLAIVFVMANCPHPLMTIFYFGTVLFPPLLFNYKNLAQKQKQKARTKEFTEKITKNDAGSFNKCKVCGKTENDEGDLEFRIADDGEEYCLEHLDQAKK